MAKLWRVDAQDPEGDGAIVFFRAALLDARVIIERMKKCGWLVDVEELDVGPLNKAQCERLCLGLWPPMPTQRIVARSFIDASKGRKNYPKEYIGIKEPDHA